MISIWFGYHDSPSCGPATASQASWIRRIVSKSQSLPVNSGFWLPAMIWGVRALTSVMRPPDRSMRATASRVRLGAAFLASEQLAEDRVDLPAVVDLAHGDRAAGLGDGLVGPPQGGAVLDEAGAGTVLVAHLQIGEVLAGRQDVRPQQLRGGRPVGRDVVAVRGLGRVDVPVVRVVALGDDALHLHERRRDQGAAGLAGAEEGLLVHLGRPVGVADEHD